ncbi:mitogen-activated protein kinase organizer 1, partial [Tremellales sp. Uapishka_1]
MAPSKDPIDLLQVPNQLSQTQVWVSGGAVRFTDRALRCRLDGHSGPVNVVRYNHGAKYCLSGSTDRSIRLWNPSTGKEIKCYSGHGHEVLALDIAHDNAKFASCGGDKLVFVWDVASGTVIRRLQGHFGKIHAVAFNKDSSVLASGSFDAKVMLWDMRAISKTPIQTLTEATNSITTLTIPTTLPEIITGSSDGHIRSYDLRMGKMTEDLVGAAISSITPSPTSPKDTLLVSSLDGNIRIFDRSNGQVLQTFAGHTATTVRSKSTFNYGEGVVLSGDEGGRLWSWNVLDGKPLNANPEAIHKKAITSVESHPSGNELLTSSTDGTIKVWCRPKSSTEVA